MERNENLRKICELIVLAANARKLKKAVLSKPSDKTLLRSVITIKAIGGKAALQAELFHKDNKVTHKNFPLDAGTAQTLAEFAGEYMQINLICEGAECEYRCSSSGKTVLLGDKKVHALLENAAPANADIEDNNRKKQYILDGSEPFLRELGVSDAKGRIFDKKQSKFRQINRFLEIIRDAEDKLPSDEIRICDLCCGKSYLSFAAYHYFSVVKGMSVSMTGVDLKPDVVEHCSNAARQLGFDGLEFVCGDINDYTPDEKPSLVISLHACDIATDIVLQKAAEWNTDVILSTPCCHHELNQNINCAPLSFITDHSMLRQKFCDAATDALRLARLESQGYITSTVELIDPNETPKNVMLRAIRNKRFDSNSIAAKRALDRYLAAKAFLCGDNDLGRYHF